MDRGALRDAATGDASVLEGEPSLTWLEAPENDLGLRAFHDHLEQAIADPEPARRSSALARALLALGGTLAVLEDAGDPAHVRNDFRASYLHSGRRAAVRSPLIVRARRRRGLRHRRACPLRARWCAGPPCARSSRRRMGKGWRIGRSGVSSRRARCPRTASSTLRRPPRRTWSATARASLAYCACPTVPRPRASRGGRSPLRHRCPDGPNGRRAGAVCSGTSVCRAACGSFWMDRSTLTRRGRLLPEIAGYAAGLIDHLLRAEIALARDGDRVKATVVAPAGHIHGGKLACCSPRTREATAPELGGFAADSEGLDGASVVVPAGTRRVAALLRGQDDAGLGGRIRRAGTSGPALKRPERVAFQAPPRRSDPWRPGVPGASIFRPPRCGRPRGRATLDAVHVMILGLAAASFGSF